MTLVLVIRRLAIFGAVLALGMTLVVMLSGESRAPRPATTRTPTTRPVTGTRAVVPMGTGTSLGPGRKGRLDRDDIAVVGNRAVPFRELTAEWATSQPIANPDSDVSAQDLGGARITIYPRPNDDHPEPVTSDAEPGVTKVSGDRMILRRRGNGPAAAHVEGAATMRHRVAADDEAVLSSDSFDLRTEIRGAARSEVRILETPDAVRVEGGGSVVTGRGLRAELAAGRRGDERRVVHIDGDVRAKLRTRDGNVRSQTPQVVDVACDGAAEIETLDRATKDGRQPWRTTFHEDVEVEDAATKMTTDLLVLDIVRTGATDRAAGADATEIRSLEARGTVRIDGRAEGAPGWHVECERLHRFAEDAVTDVTLLEGAPVLRFAGRAQDSGAARTPVTSDYEVRCKGPARIRERRSAAQRDAAAQVTIVFEGDVVVVERVAGTDEIRSEIRAPRVTVEARRGERGRIDPSSFRAENGATVRHADFSARATTIVAVSAQGGEPQRFALVGNPEARWLVREGASPLGGTAKEKGVLVLSAAQRIDADVAPPPADGAKPKGTRVAARAAGGMKAQVFEGDRESWTLVARDGDAKLGWDGAVEEMHAIGDAHLWSHGGGDARRGELTGTKITVQRGGTTTSDAWKALDAIAEGSTGLPAVATLVDGNDATRRDEIRAARLVRTDAGRTLLAVGGATAALHRSGTGTGALAASADEMRLDLAENESGDAEPRRITLTGSVVLRDELHALQGERATYDPIAGEADVRGSPARLWRVEDAKYPSYASGPVVRASFDSKAASADRFRRASLPSGGEIVGYFASPARRRVTTRCSGPLELTRTTASCTRDVVCVYESQLPDGSFNADSRIDALRVDMTLDAAVKDGRMSDRIRTLVATGSADAPARMRTRDPSGGREALAEAERIEGSQWDTKMRLSSQTDGFRVLVADLTKNVRWRCDSVTFDYVTFEWDDFSRPQQEIR